MVPSIAMWHNTIEHQSFVCTLFNGQAILLDPYIGPYQVLPTIQWLKKIHIKSKEIQITVASTTTAT